jgi:DNA polymerase
MERQGVWICNVLKCRPPDNRDPLPGEIESCRGYLRSQVELIEPVVICTLGNFSTKLLRADPTGISRLHGHEETRIIGSRAVRLYPLFHPAAALYTPSMQETLRADFQRLPELLALGPPEQPPRIDAMPEPEPEPEEPEPIPRPEEPPAVRDREPAAQLGLF